MKNLFPKNDSMLSKLPHIRTIILVCLLLGGCSSRQTTPESSTLTPEPGQPLAEENTGQSPTILILGNSLAAGYGLDDPETESFPGLIQQKIEDEDWSFEVINAGISGETTSDGLHRIDWLLKNHVDILLIELGGNDGLRGIAVETTRANLQAIIDKSREVNPDIRIVLAGMQIPPNLGQTYTSAFRDLFPEIAAENNARLIPFLLEGVGGVASLNQSDGIHPTQEGHVIVAETVWQTLRPVLEDYLACASEEAEQKLEEAGCEPSGNVFG